MLGYVTSYSYAQQGQSNLPVDSNHSFYFQDDWRIRPNLTLNLGVRWDADTSVTNGNQFVDGYNQRFVAAYGGAPPIQKVKASLHDVSPRLGLVWLFGPRQRDGARLRRAPCRGNPRPPGSRARALQPGSAARGATAGELAGSVTTGPRTFQRPVFGSSFGRKPGIGPERGPSHGPPRLHPGARRCYVIGRRIAGTFCLAQRGCAAGRAFPARGLPRRLRRDRRSTDAACHPALSTAASSSAGRSRGPENSPCHGPVGSA